MTEGPSARAKAIYVEKNVGGQKVVDIFTRSKKTHVSPKEFIGRKLEYTDSYGKNIILVFGPYAIRIHLMMYGTIHIYGPNQPLAKPERYVRLLILFETNKVVVYNAPIVELDLKANIIRYLQRTLGEDPLREDWDQERAIDLILKHRNEKIGAVLLNQGVIAGIGNILRNEILFRARIHPDRYVRDLTRDELRRIVSIAYSLSREFLRRKLNKQRIGPILYVYNKFKKKCKICGHPIRYYRQPPHNRRTFVCENCQK